MKINFSIQVIDKVNRYYIIILQAKCSQSIMNEYQENMDFTDVFNIFTLCNKESSQVISIYSHQQPQIWEKNYSIQSQLEISRQQKTADKTPTQPAQQKMEKYSVGSSGPYWLQYSREVKNRNEIVRQGSKDDTVELNINFKTIIYNHFKELLHANQLTPQQQQKLYQFGSRSPSFKSLELFCKTDLDKGISSLCQNFIQSSLIVRKILESKCRMSTKLNMIKFVEVLRLNMKGNGRIIKWKQAWKL